MIEIPAYTKVASPIDFFNDIFFWLYKNIPFMEEFIKNLTREIGGIPYLGSLLFLSMTFLFTTLLKITILKNYNIYILIMISALINYILLGVFL